MSGFTRRTVLTRVLLSYVVVTLAFAAVAGFSVLGQRRSVRDTERMRSGYMPLALALRDAVSGQNTFNSQLNHITEASNPADKEIWFETAIAVGRTKTFAKIRSALSRAFTDDSRSLAVQLSQQLRDVQNFVAEDREIVAQLFQALDEQDMTGAQGLRDRLVLRGAQALVMLRTLEQHVNLELDTLIDGSSQRERWTLRILWAWAVFTVLVGVGVALYARALLRPLLSVTQRARAVAAGDLRPQSVAAARDEIGELAETFEAMVTAIARANRELLEAERLATIGKMAAQVTHEVRNPLFSIGLNLELLEEELSRENEEARTLHQAIKEEVERLTGLTQQYLSVARRKDPDLHTEELEEVVESAALFVGPELERHGVTLSLDLQPELPTLRLDAAQMRQVLHNLVRNARQAMPEGGRVEISARQVDEEAAVELTVSDTGTGIAEELQDRLFEPFASTKSNGTGLGLAVSRDIIEAHGGAIYSEARGGGGTRFIIRLPVPGVVSSSRSPSSPDTESA